MRKIIVLNYLPYVKAALFSFIFFSGVEIKAQTYNDGPVELQLKIRRIQVTCPSTDDTLTIGSQTGFAPDEFTYKVWVRDNADLDGQGWVGGSCLMQDFSPPGNSVDFNVSVFNHTYSSIVPRYFDLKLEAWENDCGSDGYPGHNCSGNRCTYNDSCCCVTDTTGCIQFDDDDLYCNAEPFMVGLDYRLGAPGQWYNHGFISGGGCNNNCYQLEVETYWQSDFSGTITGKFFYDLNGNCNPDTSEPGLKGILVKAAPGPIYSLSDQAGYYSIPVVDTGIYTVSVSSQGVFQTTCSTFYNAHVTSSVSTIGDKDFAFLPYPCSYLSIDMSTPFLRSCRDAMYTVQYCNKGTTIADSAYIVIEMDSFLTVNSSSIPWRLPQSGNSYLFDIGDVDIQDCGTFTIDVTVSCDAVLGQTHCVTAHIYPDSICTPRSPAWDSSSVKVEAECINGDTVQFRISNVGSGDMQDSLPAIIVEDIVMLRSLKFKLISGAFITPKVLANGSTFRLEAQQSPNHPGRSMPSVAVEGCGTNTSGGISLGFVTTFPQDDANPFISIDCQENIGAYDPNDKIGYPKGVGTQKVIHSEYDLKYKIRFQNTGTDTAFRVVIRDTLSEYLDIATVIPGASSHPYEFRIFGPGILEWTFDNILLPDSNINEPASHGFVKYRVEQIDSNLNGTLIENSADIYFDYNAPIKTNTEFHTVGDIYDLILSVAESYDPDNIISIYPNPFDQHLNIEINAAPFESLTFEIWDLPGRMIRNYHNSNTNKIIISNLNLTKGMYFYLVVAKDGVIGSGKIIGF